ncbi:MAG: hypothetical protein FWC64_12220 [Treponema sp.]|nr:hypothetical protein [Treponema sp.]
MNEKASWIVVSVALSITVIIVVAKIRRSTADTFYMQIFTYNFLFSMLFGMSIWILHDVLSESFSLQDIGIGLVFVLLVWGVPLCATLNVLFQCIRLKENTLIIPSLKFTRRNEYINATKISCILEITRGQGDGEYSMYKINMSDSTCFEMHQGIENIEYLFARMREINDKIHFSFDLHRIKEESFLRRCFNLSAIISLPIYTIGFYAL